MSRASEWIAAVARAKSLEPPALKDKDGKELASVDECDGGVYVTEKFWTPDEAEQLARWILDTFSDPKATE